MGEALGIDLRAGACAAARWRAGRLEACALGDGTPTAAPAALTGPPTGAATDPDPVAATAALLAAVAGRALAGQPVDAVGIAHALAADDGPGRLAEQAAAVTFPTTVLVARPVALAARFVDAGREPGRVAVLDADGLAVTVALVHHDARGFDLVGAPAVLPEPDDGVDVAAHLDRAVDLLTAAIAGADGPGPAGALVAGRSEWLEQLAVQVRVGTGLATTVDPEPEVAAALGAALLAAGPERHGSRVVAGTAAAPAAVAGGAAVLAPVGGSDAEEGAPPGPAPADDDAGGGAAVGSGISAGLAGPGDVGAAGGEAAGEAVGQLFGADGAGEAAGQAVGDLLGGAAGDVQRLAGGGDAAGGSTGEALGDLFGGDGAGEAAGEAVGDLLGGAAGGVQRLAGAGDAAGGASGEAVGDLFAGGDGVGKVQRFAGREGAAAGKSGGAYGGSSGAGSAPGGKSGGAYGGSSGAGAGLGGVAGASVGRELGEEPDEPGRRGGGRRRRVLAGAAAAAVAVLGVIGAVQAFGGDPAASSDIETGAGAEPRTRRTTTTRGSTRPDATGASTTTVTVASTTTVPASGPGGRDPGPGGGDTTPAPGAPGGGTAPDPEGPAPTTPPGRPTTTVTTPADTTGPAVSALSRSPATISEDGFEFCAGSLTTVLTATITDPSGVTGATVGWSGNGDSGGGSMTRSGSTWQATLGPVADNPDLPYGQSTTITWTVTATDGAGNTTSVAGPSLTVEGC